MRHRPRQSHLLPNELYEFNRGHPLAYGLVGAWLLSSRYSPQNWAGDGRYGMTPSASAPTFDVMQGRQVCRLFTRASSQDMASSATPVTAVPLSMSALVHTADLTNDQTLVAVIDNATAGNAWSLVARGSAAGDPLSAVATASGTSSLASTAGAYPSTRPFVATGVFASSTDRRVFIDGASKATNSTSRSPGTPNSISIGSFRSSSPTNYFNGRIGRVLLWNRALSDAEVLWDAVNPYWFLIERRRHSKFYFPQTIVLDQDSVTLNGQDVSVALGAITGSPDQADINVIGQDVTTSFGAITASMDQADITISGQDAGVAFGAISVEITQDSITLVGQDVGTALGAISVTLDQDSINLVGQDVSASLVTTLLATLPTAVIIVNPKDLIAGLVYPYEVFDPAEQFMGWPYQMQYIEDSVRTPDDSIVSQARRRHERSCRLWDLNLANLSPGQVRWIEDFFERHRGTGKQFNFIVPESGGVENVIAKFASAIEAQYGNGRNDASIRVRVLEVAAS